MSRKPPLFLRLLFYLPFHYVPAPASARSSQPVVHPPHPSATDPNAWRVYWQALNQPWRTEPEIDIQRQKELARQRTISPNIEQGIYPFKDMRLSRADVEWLLATHENGWGPVNWADESQRDREGIDLRGANLQQADLRKLPLARARLGLTSLEWWDATDEQRRMAAAHLEQANLIRTHLEGAHLRYAYLEGATLRFTFLERTHLRGAWLKGVDFSFAHLAGARLEEVILSDDKRRGPLFADAQLSGVNLAVVDWSQINMLGDEQRAREKILDGKRKDYRTRRREYEAAVRANRQLALALQSQGLNEDATRFAYHAQVLQRDVLWLQMTPPGAKLRQRMQIVGSWLFSWFLFLLAGYGYRPARSFFAYLLVITSFATAYYLLGHTIGSSLSPLSAFVFSMTSFHGRGFFPGNNIQLDNPLTVFAAFEALVGLIIEVTFIATLTQRFFNR